MDGALGLSTEQIVGGLYGLLLLGMAAVQVMSNRGKAAPMSNDPVLTGIGAKFGSDLQMERLIEAVEKIADTLDTKRVNDMDAKLERLTRQLDQALSKPAAMRSHPRRGGRED